MKITFMTLQKASIVCLGVGMFLALGSAGTFETTGEIQTGVYVAAFVFLLAAGLLLKLVENVPEGAAFCFDGKSKKQKIDQNDIIRELFDLGMGGSFYAQVVKVPEEYPVEDLSTVLLYEPEETAKIFAQLCGYTLLDKNGRVVTGRMPGQEEQK